VIAGAHFAEVHAATRLVRFPRAGSRRVTLRLSARGRRFLGRRPAAIAVSVQQRVGRGVRATDGGYTSAYRRFG
jgi:hypothetical protein